MARQGIYAVYDNKAQDTVGFLSMHRHEASAIRMFTDIYTMKDSRFAQHADDYDLIRVGFLTITDEGKTELTSAYELILTGTKVAATINVHQQLHDGDDDADIRRIK